MGQLVDEYTFWKIRRKEDIRVRNKTGVSTNSQ